MRLGFRSITITGIAVYLMLAAVSWFFHIDFPLVVHDGMRMRLSAWITYYVVLLLFAMPLFRTAIHLLFTGRLVNKYFASNAVSGPLVFYGYCALTAALVVKGIQPFLLPLLSSMRSIDQNRAGVVQLLIALPVFFVMVGLLNDHPFELQLWSYRRSRKMTSPLPNSTTAKAKVIHNTVTLNP